MIYVCDVLILTRLYPVRGITVVEDLLVNLMPCESENYGVYTVTSSKLSATFVNIRMLAKETCA